MSREHTILVVDDQRAGRAAMEALFRADGYQLVFAGSGSEALLKAAELQPELILLDVVMPDMNGYEVCQRLRADPEVAEVPIIMVTGLEDLDARLRGIESGADDFISKPFDPVEFQARVRTITRLGRFRRLLAERAKFEWLVEQAEEGYLILNQRDEILYANQQARLYLDLNDKKSENGGRYFLDLARERYQCEPKEAWVSWPDPPTDALPSPRYLVYVETPTAPAFWIQVELLSLRAEPDAGWLVRMRDVSAKMTLQRDTWKFHSVITHKLRTPVASTLQSMELLSRHAGKLSPEEVAELADSALQNMQRLQDRLDNIFQYLTVPTLALPGAGFFLSHLAPLVEEIAEDLGLEKVKVSVPEPLENTRVLLSSQGMALILKEILENSKKFHPRQAPEITIEIEPNSVREIALRISDDGQHLSPEQLHQIWTPYYQSERHFTGEVDGMGLGLPMVAALLWEAGGTSRIYNREEAPGITVELMLPTRRKLPPLSF